MRRDKKLPHVTLEKMQKMKKIAKKFGEGEMFDVPLHRISR